MMNMILSGMAIGIAVLIFLSLFFSLYVAIRNDWREERKRKLEKKGW